MSDETNKDNDEDLPPKVRVALRVVECEAIAFVNEVAEAKELVRCASRTLIEYMND